MGSLRRFAANVPPPCRASDCERHGCSVDLRGLFAQAGNRRQWIVSRFHYLRINSGATTSSLARADGTTWVVPVELKSGSIGNVNEVLRQLEGGRG